MNPLLELGKKLKEHRRTVTSRGVKILRESARENILMNFAMVEQNRSHGHGHFGVVSPFPDRDIFAANLNVLDMPHILLAKRISDTESGEAAHQ